MQNTNDIKENKDWDNILSIYINTLDRINADTLPLNIYIRKPLIQNYYIELIKMKDKKIIKQNILQKITESEIEIEDVLYVFSTIFDLSKNDKKIIRDCLSNNNNNASSSISSISSISSTSSITNIIVSLIYFYVSYIEFYLVISELLYHKNTDFLNHDIYIYIQNNQKIISKKIKNWKNNNQMNRIHSYIIFNNLLQELYINYKKLYNLLVDNEWMPQLNSKHIFNHYLKFLFTPWFNTNKLNDMKEQEPIKKQEPTKLKKMINSLKRIIKKR